MGTKSIKSFLLFVLFLFFTTCGCGPTFLYNWRPKPWNYHYDNQYTGLDTLINTDAYYVYWLNENTIPVTRIYNGKDTIVYDVYLQSKSILFYNNGLCASSSSSYSNKSRLETLYNNRNEDKYCNECLNWGTYEVIGVRSRSI